MQQAEELFFSSSEPTLCEQTNVCLALVCTVSTKDVAHVKDPMSIIEKEKGLNKANGLETHRQCKIVAE